MFFEAIRYAAKSSDSRAGACAPLPGALVVFLGLRLMGYQIAAPETWEQGIAAFLLCAGSAWVIIFVCRLLYWPYRELRIARFIVDKRKTRETLGLFLHEGSILRGQCGNEKEQPPEDAAIDWANKVEDFLCSSLDESYVARFRDGSNLPMTANSIASLAHRHLWSWIRVRMARLQEFIKELSSG
jgi:hypothetical protein